MMETIQSYGYTVTAPEDAIVEIKDIMSDKKCRINWYNFRENNMFWNNSGNGGWKIKSIDHENKTVVLE